MPKRSVNQWHYIVEALHGHNVLLDTREIFIHGSMDVNEDLDDAGVDHRMANKFVKNMRLLETLPGKDKPIVIHQHSVGGDWWAGMMMFDVIARCECPILFIYHGIAASMGSIIPQACSYHQNAYRVAMPQTWLMVHDGTTDINSGLTMKQAKSLVEVEDETSRRMLEFYVKGCQGGPYFSEHTEEEVGSYIRKKMDEKEDWWLDAKDMVKYGFADAVMGDEGYESIDYILKNWE